MFFFIVGEVVKVRVWTYGVPDNKNEPRFRTGSTFVPGMIEGVPLSRGQPYIVRVASNHCLSAIPEELAPAHDIDPAWARSYLRIYRWPTEYQARQDAAAQAKRAGTTAETPSCPPNPAPAATPPLDPLHPRASPIPESERVLTKAPKPPRQRGRPWARRGTTPP